VNYAYIFPFRVMSVGVQQMGCSVEHIIYVRYVVLNLHTLDTD
jgi:hypothetical protein